MTAEAIERIEDEAEDELGFEEEPTRLVELRVEVSEQVTYSYPVRLLVPESLDLGDKSALHDYLAKNSDYVDTLPVSGYVVERSDAAWNPADRTVFLEVPERDLEGVRAVGVVDESTGDFTLGGLEPPRCPQAEAWYKLSFFSEGAWVQHPASWRESELEQARELARRFRTVSDKVRLRGERGGRAVSLEEI